MEKKFKIPKVKIVQLITASGSGIATDKITVDGELVGYMYRENPDFETDSGWRFFSGSEDQEYVDEASNLAIYNLNTIANYDPAIIPHLSSAIGTHLERDSNNDFILMSQTI